MEENNKKMEAAQRKLVSWILAKIQLYVCIAWSTIKIRNSFINWFMITLLAKDCDILIMENN